MDFPTKRDIAARLSILVREKLPFFTHTPTLACEESILFSQAEKPKTTPILNPTARRPVAPTFDGIFSSYDLALEPLKISLVLLKPKSKGADANAILFDMFHYKIIYYPTTKRSSQVLNSSISVVNSTLHWKDEKFKILTAREKTGLAGIAAALRSFSTNKLTIDVNEHTKIFCAQICCNFQTLYVMARGNLFGKETPSAPWVNACGKNLLFMVRLIGFCEYQKLSEPHTVFRGNNAFTRTATDLIRADSGVSELCANLARVDVNDIEVQMKRVFEEFDVTKVGARAGLVLRTIWDLGLQKFPQTEACYFGISGALMLRIVIAYLWDNGWDGISPEKKRYLQEVLNLKGAHSEAVATVKNFIEKLVMQEYGEFPVDDLQQETLEVLMQVIQEKADKFEAGVNDFPFADDWQAFTKWENSDKPLWPEHK